MDLVDSACILEITLVTPAGRSGKSSPAGANGHHGQAATLRGPGNPASGSYRSPPMQRGLLSRPIDPPFPVLHAETLQKSSPAARVGFGKPAL